MASEATTATARDRGLVHGIGTIGMTANVVNGTIGSGIFTLPAAVALAAGAAAPWAYVVCALFLSGVVLCFAEAGSRVPTSGGLYGTAAAAMGPAGGLVAGMLLLVSDVLAAGGIAVAVADMVARLVPAMAGASPRAALLAGEFALVAAVNLAGVRVAVRVVTGAAAVKLLPLLLFLGVAAAAWAEPAPGGALPPPTPGGFVHAMILTLFALGGMETPLAVSGEVRDPARTLPRALVLAIGFVLIVYVGVQLGAERLLGAALPGSRAPLAEGAARVSGLAGAVLYAGAGVSMAGWMVSNTLGMSRLLFAFARDGLLPGALAGLSARHVPAPAILVYVLIAWLLAVSGTFMKLVTLSALGMAGLYVMACLSALLLWRRGVALAGKPLGLRFLPVAAGLGLAGMAVLIAGAAWDEIFGLFAVVAGSLLWHALRRGRA